jgi:hypothetical protein
MMSVEVPGVNCAMMRIGRLGYACPEPFDKLRTGSVEAGCATDVVDTIMPAMAINPKYLILFIFYLFSLEEKQLRRTGAKTQRKRKEQLFFAGVLCVFAPLR